MNASFSFLRLALTVFVFGLMSAVVAQNTNDVLYYRPYGKRGNGVFETSKTPWEGADTGFKVRIGGHFAQQFQALKHSSQIDFNNNGVADFSEGKDTLYPLGPGFNLATANLVIDAQLADGVTLNLTTYLSAKHHQETWVKGGYIQFDKLPFLNLDFVDKAMEILTIKVGHYEINYGDAHFRRTDNGNAIQNTFVGEYIMDGFTTEIGGEIIAQKNGFLGVFGVTGNRINGDIKKPTEATASVFDDNYKRQPALLGKLGYDKQLNDDLRVRVTGSFYHSGSSAGNTLYGGDRGGSRYYLVLEPKTATTTANYTSGRFNPGFTDKVTSFMLNGFVKFHGLEFFGTYETSKGRAASEAFISGGDTTFHAKRAASQYAAELIYRIGENENYFIGARYNAMKAQQYVNTTTAPLDININRYQIVAGMYFTDNVMMKVEYVNQNYNGFRTTDIRNGGNFKGLMLEACVGF